MLFRQKLRAAAVTGEQTAKTERREELHSPKGGASKRLARARTGTALARSGSRELQEAKARQTPKCPCRRPLPAVTPPGAHPRRPPRGCAGTGSGLRMDSDESMPNTGSPGKHALTCRVLAAGGALRIHGICAAGHLRLRLRLWLWLGRGRNVALRRQGHRVEPPATWGPSAATCGRKRAHQGPVSHAGSSP